jgi:hypothetical protein
MPIRYTIDPAASVITMTLTGDVTSEDFRDYFETTAKDPAYHPHLQRLIEIRDVRSFPQSSEVRVIASHIRPRTNDPSVHIAIVADTPLGRGVMAMIMGGAGLADRYRVFDDVTTATVWLLTASRAGEGTSAILIRD